MIPPTPAPPRIPPANPEGVSKPPRRILHHRTCAKPALAPRMVSLGRLLAAASDSPDSSQGHSRSAQTTSEAHWLQDHALSEEVFSSVFGPEGSNAGLVPGALRQAFSSGVSADGEASRVNNPEKSAIPLDQFMADLGPETTVVQNMAAFKRALLSVGVPSEDAIAKALIMMAEQTLRGPTEADSDAMSLFQLLGIFDPEAQDAVKDPVASDAASARWNFEVFVMVLNEVASQSKAEIDWNAVVQALDCAELAPALNEVTFREIAKAYSVATSGSRLPGSVLFDRWQQQRSQSVILANALKHPQLVNWNNLKTFPGCSDEDQASPFSKISVLERMVDLNMIGELQYAIETKPELVLMCLACAQPEYNSHIQHQLIVTLVGEEIIKFPSSANTIRQLWSFAPAFVAGGLLAMWRKDMSSADLALDIACTINALEDLLTQAMPTEFAFDIALLTYSRQQFGFEAWLSQYLLSHGVQAPSQCIVHLADKIVKQDVSGVAKLAVDALRIAFRVIYNAVHTMRSIPAVEVVADDWQRVHDAYVRSDPRIANLDPANDLGDRSVLFGASMNQAVSRSSMPIHRDGPTSAQTAEEVMYAEGRSSIAQTESLAYSAPSDSFSKDVEDEVNVHFHSLYKGSISTEETIELLRQLQASQVERDRKVFDCMIHTLFDEYRFFKNYPDKELQITGLLFGAFVQYSLFQGQFLEMALERVLTALQDVKSDEDAAERVGDASQSAEEQIGRMAKFGLCALDRFRKRLPEWPLYCSRILRIPHLKVIAPELLGEVESVVGAVPNVLSGTDASGMVSAEAPMASSPERHGRTGTVLGSPSKTPKTSFDVAAKDTADFVRPEESVCERIGFITNNLSSANVDDKKEQLVEFLKPEHFPYFIHYLVRRAIQEGNNHELYLKFLGKLQTHIPNLFKLILETSFTNVDLLLSSDRLASNAAERQMQRTLGAWIGRLTLGRNKPILHRDLDVKKLLLEAYSGGRLSPVVPFVAKVLLGSKGSKVFKPTNPWIKAMLSILKEISEIEDLKLNLKFELPSLLSALDIETSDIVPSNLLKDVQPPSRVNNPDIRRSPQASPRSSAPSPDSMAFNRIERNTALSAAAPTGSSPIMTSALEARLSTGLQSHVGMSIGMGGGHMGSGMLSTDAVSDLASVLGGTVIGPGGHNAAMHSVTGNGSGNMQTGIASNGQMGVQPQVGTPNGQEATIVPNFAQLVNVSPSLPLFQNSPTLRSLLPIAIDRALKDIIQPVVERSCAIASLTTRELTLKDFANEPNVSKIRKAAQQMVQQLAGSLALVTCKEPLRVAMGNHVRSILTSAVGVDTSTIDTTAQHICAANLEMGCQIIERAAKEKAVRDLNDVIAPAFSNVRRQPQTGYGMTGPPGPDVLKVYADFSRLPRTILGGEGSRLSPSLNSSAIPSVHPIGASTNPSGPQGLSMPASSAVPVFTSSQGTIPGDNLQDPRLVAENDSLHVPLYSNTSNALHSQIPGSSLDAVGGGASTALRGMTANSDAQWTSAPSTEAQPLMAAPEAMNSAMLQAVVSLNSAQANRQSMLPSSLSMTGIGDEALSTPQVLEKFNLVYAQLSTVISDMTSLPVTKELTLGGLPGDHEINQLWTQIPLAVKKSVTADEASMAVAQKVFKRLYEGSSLLYREVHVALLDGLRESCRRLSKELVIWLAYSEEHKKLNRECIVALLKPKSLINITSYDELLSKTIDNGRNSRALDFAAFLVQRAVIDEPLVTSAELALTFDTLTKIGKRPNPPTLASAPNGILSLVEAGRNVSSRKTASSNSGDQSESSSAHKMHKETEPVDPAGSREYVNGILTEWQRLITSEASHQVLATFLGHLRSKTLNAEDSRERFCRISVELVVSVTTTALIASGGVDGVNSDLASIPYTAVESTVRLVGGLCGDESSQNTSESLSRSSLILSSFLTVLVKNILKTPEDADLRPHFRLFTGLLTELSTDCPLTDSGDVLPGASAQPDSSTGNTGENDIVLFSRVQSFGFLDGKSDGLLAFARELCGSRNSPDGADGVFNIANPSVLAMCSGALLACAPRAAPGFAFCWLQIVAGRNILPRLLNSSTGKSWLLFRQLLVSMLTFLSPHLRRPKNELSEALKHLYKGTLRVLLVLLHDFPEFLCDYHFALCDAIPPNCIQLRNLVLAAFPKNMRLPDPFRPELQAGQLPEMTIQPRILSNFTVALVRAGIKGVIDNFLQNATFRNSVTSLDLSPRLMTQKSSPGETVYSVPTINAVALYVGQHSLSRNANSVELAVGGPGTTFFRTLLAELDAEGQYFLVNALSNQLRYPNLHTHYFSSVLLVLFKETRDDALKELITRVLVERLIANRPHPWGLLITFIDLIKNPEFNFWQHEFVRCAPQIEHLFENVARFCIGPALQQNSVAG